MLTRTIDRRRLLKGLGVITVGAPMLVSCASDGAEATGAGGTGPAGAGGTGAGGIGGSAAGTNGAAGMTGVAGTTGPAGTNGAAGTTGLAGSSVAGSGPAGAGGAVDARGGAGGGAGASGPGGVGGAAGKAGAGGTVAGQGGIGGVAGAGGAMGTGGSLVPPSFDNVTTCTLTPTDGAGEGPFFIHEDEVNNDPTIFRQDMRDGHPGVELQLHLRVLDQSMGCNTPIRDVEVYIWHTDALGFYSGFANQDPNMSYRGAAERTVENADRFCRGAQLTNADGVVSFRTLFPGWYNGRAIHIHFVALKKGSGPTTQSYRGTQYMVFTTQMYFEEAFSKNIHEKYDPYKTRASGTNYARYVKPETMVRPTVTMKNDVAIGALNILTSSTGSRR